LQPTATEAGVGLTVIDCSTGAGAAVTASAAAGLLTTPPDVAVMLGASGCHSRSQSGCTLMAAAVVAEELQVTPEARGWVLPLL
jgi:hypothetical protein